LPSLLLAHGGGYHLPDSIISSEHLTLEGRKISTSQNWAIWVKDIVTKYNPDAIRYFFIADGRFREGIERAFALVRFGNRYYDGREPWGNIAAVSSFFV
jgi:methionyl-tRNA synthetase